MTLLVKPRPQPDMSSSKSSNRLQSLRNWLAQSAPRKSAPRDSALQFPWTFHSRLTLAWDHGPRSCSGDEKSRDGGATRAHRDPDIRRLTAVRKWISWRFGTRMARSGARSGVAWHSTAAVTEWNGVRFVRGFIRVGFIKRTGSALTRYLATLSPPAPPPLSPPPPRACPAHTACSPPGCS